MIRTAKKESKSEIEWLAGVLAQNFAAIDKRFNAVDTKFEAIETRLDRADVKLETIETKLIGVQNNMSTLEDEVHGTNDRLDSFIVPHINDHARRIKNLELKSV